MLFDPPLLFFNWLQHSSHNLACPQLIITTFALFVKQIVHVISFEPDSVQESASESDDDNVLTAAMAAEADIADACAAIKALCFSSFNFLLSRSNLSVVYDKHMLVGIT
jgi:hypothetical protein